LKTSHISQISGKAEYRTLLAKIKRVLVEGQARIEQERVRTYWETGTLIRAHVLKYADRAEYGSAVILNLAKDMSIDRSVLNRCVLFAEKYPRLPIGAHGHQFKWSHYRKFITVADDKKRLSLEKAATQKGWSVDELAVRIKEDAALEKEPELPASKPLSNDTPLVPLRGTLYTYRLVERPNLSADAETGLLVDLGFGVYHEVDGRLLSAFSKDQIVESRPKEDAYKFYGSTSFIRNRTIPSERKQSEGLPQPFTAKNLFTYNAFVEKVVDGDTVKVRLDLGFKMQIRQILRLRDIDCPEVGSSAGDEAKAFVRSHLKEAQMIIVRSSRSDKYDRYLADVFIPKGGEPDPETDIYLNNLLLETGRAVRV